MKKIEGTYALCKIKPQMSLPFWATHTQFLVVVRTKEAMSILLEEQYLPPNVEGKRGLELYELDEGEEAQGFRVSSLDKNYLVK